MSTYLSQQSCGGVVVVGGVIQLRMRSSAVYYGAQLRKYGAGPIPESTTFLLMPVGDLGQFDGF